MNPPPVQPSVDPLALLALITTAIKAQLIAEQQVKPQSAGPRLLKVKQAAEYLGRTESSLRQLIFKKILPVIRFDRAIRIDVRDLDKLIDEYRT